MYIETDHLGWVLGHPLVRVVLQDPVMRALPGGGHLSVLWFVMDEFLGSRMVGEEKVFLRACIEFILLEVWVSRQLIDTRPLVWVILQACVQER